MPLTPGTRLGPYEIVAPLGAGGMGEVYRARDTRLDRTVALKVLGAALAATGEAHVRFEREARAVAALQHPHICVLHDLGSEAGQQYLVMEYLEGETLAARLRRGPLPLAEVVKLGGEIASALARAHSAGIVHRDLKPANVMWTKSGAKLLDFGLAKSGVISGVTLTALEPTTQAGAVLGTIPYMAPEQLEGREADARSDLYALGCVLYEMSTGEAAFKGTHPVAPPALNRLIQACLAPNPDDRLQSAHDAGLMLTAAGEAPPPSRESRRRGWLWPAIAAAAALAAALAAWMLRPLPSAAPTITEITPPPGLHFRFGGSLPGLAAISPDGRQIVFAAANSSGHSSLWLRAMDSAAPRELAGTQDAVFPFWSPDSRAIGFFSQVGGSGAGDLMVLSLAGGLPRSLAEAATARGGAWAADGTIVFAPQVAGGLMRTSASGGPVAPLAACDLAQFSSCRFPSFLPDGRHFLYLAISPDDSSKDMIFESSLDGRMNRPLVHALASGIFAGGQLLYSADGVLMAQPLNPSTGTLSGAPRPVASGVYDDAVTWRPAYSASSTGTLIYASGTDGAQEMAWVGRDGKVVTPLPAYTGQVFAAALAPDGQRLAVSLDQGLQDIWIEPVSGGARSRLTFGPISNIYPVWSPDGAWVAYGTVMGGHVNLARRPAGGGPQQVFAASKAQSDGVGGWSRDGREILCGVSKSGHAYLVAAPVAGGPLRVIANLANVGLLDPQLSPDDRWASYLAAEPGQPANLYVVPFRGNPGSVWQVTTGGAIRHFWVNGGKELDVIDTAGRLLAISVSVSGDAPTFGTPRLVASNFPPVFAATADGQRFLAAFNPDDDERLMVMTNWQSR